MNNVKWSGGAYPLFIKVVEDVADRGVCVRLQEYSMRGKENVLSLHTAGGVLDFRFKDVAYFLEAYRSLEDCLLKGFHLLVLRGVVSVDVLE